MMSTSKKAWAKAIAQPAKEFPLTDLSIISGAIPAGLNGTLYRNGAARLSRGKDKVGHWFDGDGAVLAVHFKSEGAKAVYRYVQTKGYQAEERKNRLIFPNYGMTAPGGFWHSWGKEVKNAANTSVIALKDRLLTLWEGGKPHALDWENLETIGLDDLAALENQQAFSAHPKIEPETGTIFNFGVSIGRQAKLHLYRCSQDGVITQQNTLILKTIPFIHDFVLAGNYIIFFIPPVRFNPLPVLLGFTSYSDAMHWQPQLGTEILVFDCQNLELISRGKTEPWFQWHFSNGYYRRDGLVVIELVRYADFATNRYLQEVSTGKTTTSAVGNLWEICLNPRTSQVVSTKLISPRGCEFPVVAPSQVGKDWRYTYLSVHRDEVDPAAEIFGAIARFERETGKSVIADMGDNCYPSEPIFVSNSDNSEQGWVLTVVYDGNTHRSEVRIYASEQMDQEPICRLALPEVIPHSFHGTWRAATK